MRYLNGRPDAIFAAARPRDRRRSPIRRVGRRSVGRVRDGRRSSRCSTEPGPSIGEETQAAASAPPQQPPSCFIGIPRDFSNRRTQSGLKIHPTSGSILEGRLELTISFWDHSWPDPSLGKYGLVSAAGNRQWASSGCRELCVIDAYTLRRRTGSKSWVMRGLRSYD